MCIRGAADVHMRGSPCAHAWQPVCTRGAAQWGARLPSSAVAPRERIILGRARITSWGVHSTLLAGENCRWELQVRTAGLCVVGQLPDPSLSRRRPEDSPE
eukprot:7993968-Pyramimonas_sp.AAC.1